MRALSRKRCLKQLSTLSTLNMRFCLSQGVSGGDVEYRPVKCKRRCRAVESCVFLQYEADTCYLCIHDAADAAGENYLTSSAAPPQAVRTHVKLGIADVIFTSTQPCHLPVDPPGVSSIDYYRISTSGPITRMRFCWFSTFNNIVGGFYATFDGAEQPLAGCNEDAWTGVLRNDNAYPTFELANHEVVLHIIACFAPVQGYTVVNTLTIVTNLRQVGPHGTDRGNCVSYHQSGYNLMGLYGKSGWGLSGLGSVFERC